jgi:hypothetical protein
VAGGEANDRARADRPTQSDKRSKLPAGIERGMGGLLDFYRVQGIGRFDQQVDFTLIIVTVKMDRGASARHARSSSEAR